MVLTQGETLEAVVAVFPPMLITPRHLGGTYKEGRAELGKVRTELAALCGPTVQELWYHLVIWRARALKKDSLFPGKGVGSKVV